MYLPLNKLYTIKIKKRMRQKTALAIILEKQIHKHSIINSTLANIMI